MAREQPSDLFFFLFDNELQQRAPRTMSEDAPKTTICLIFYFIFAREPADVIQSSVARNSVIRELKYQIEIDK